MSAPSSSALPAFLRGIEPRARVLARAQAGPSLDDERLLATVREDFTQRAARLPLAEWPLRYWGLLLARDELGSPSGQTPSHPLYRLTHTRRLALLLRLVVGMEPAGAARVMGLSETAYRALWADAEDRLAEEGVGPAVLMRWHEAFQKEVRGEAAQAPASGAARPSTSRVVRGMGRRIAWRPSRWRLPRWRPTGLQWGLGAVAAVLLAILGATFLWPPGEGGTGRPAGGAAPSPAAAGLEPPAEASPRDLEAELVVDPDFALLAAAPDAAWRQGVAFLSWWTAGTRTALPPPGPARPAPAVPFASLPPEPRRLLAPVRAAWDALDAEAQRALLANATTWSGMAPAERRGLREAYAAWVALPALERSARRAGFADWQALDDGERAALQAAAEALAALAPEQQQAQRAAFAGLDPQAQRDWAMGPRLGAQLPGLRPLLAFVPADEQAALIDAIEAMGDEARTALAARVAAMGAAQRAALRGRVLAAPQEARPGLLAEAAAAP